MDAHGNAVDAAHSIRSSLHSCICAEQCSHKEARIHLRGLQVLHLTWACQALQAAAEFELQPVTRSQVEEFFSNIPIHLGSTALHWLYSAALALQRCIFRGSRTLQGCGAPALARTRTHLQGASAWPGAARGDEGVALAGLHWFRFEGHKLSHRDW